MSDKVFPKDMEAIMDKSMATTTAVNAFNNDSSEVVKQKLQDKSLFDLEKEITDIQTALRKSRSERDSMVMKLKLLTEFENSAIKHLDNLRTSVQIKLNIQHDRENKKPLVSNNISLNGFIKISECMNYSSDKICSICQQEWTEDDLKYNTIECGGLRQDFKMKLIEKENKLIKFKCGVHYFHEDCANGALRFHAKCPTCRIDVEEKFLEGVSIPVLKPTVLVTEVNDNEEDRRRINEYNAELDRMYDRQDQITELLMSEVIHDDGTPFTHAEIYEMSDYELDQFIEDYEDYINARDAYYIPLKQWFSNDSDRLHEFKYSTTTQLKPIYQRERRNRMEAIRELMVAQNKYYRSELSKFTTSRLMDLMDEYANPNLGPLITVPRRPQPQSNLILQPDTPEQSENEDDDDDNSIDGSIHSDNDVDVKEELDNKEEEKSDRPRGYNSEENDSGSETESEDNTIIPPDSLTQNPARLPGIITFSNLNGATNVTMQDIVPRRIEIDLGLTSDSESEDDDIAPQTPSTRPLTRPRRPPNAPIRIPMPTNQLRRQQAQSPATPVNTRIIITRAPQAPRRQRVNNTRITGQVRPRPSSQENDPDLRPPPMNRRRTN